MQPLLNLHNRGNTCWAASAVQALRGLKTARRMCTPSTCDLFRKALCDAKGVPDAVVPHLFVWARQILKNQEGCGHRPADPAEWFVELCDREQDANTRMFEAKRVKRYECLQCGHVRHVENEEKVLILPCLQDGATPVQTAVDLEFGYQRPIPSTPPVIPPPVLSPSDAFANSQKGTSPATSPGTPPVYPGGAPPLPMSYSEYNQGFGRPVPASVHSVDVVPGETWWRCDDGQVVEVTVDRATPYLLFYEERATPASAAEAQQGGAGQTAEGTCQILPLDCDHGKCGGVRQRHTAYVSSYEMNSVLAVQIACPQLMSMRNVERTLYTGASPSADNPEGEYRAYDLKSFVSRVSGCHYVAYIKHK
jgi:hypothetical protein